MTARQSATERTIGDLVFVGLNRKVIALDRYGGQVVWEWKSPKGRGFVTILVDGDRLIVGVSGYIYCLDPLFGQLVWENPLEGYGMGFTHLASLRGSSDPAAAVAAAVAAQQTAAAAGAGAAHG